MNDFKPFKLVETAAGKYSLLLTEFDGPATEVLEELGHEGGGYAWEGVAKSLVRLRAPELQDRFNYDPEASMFCAYGTDRAALERLGGILSSAWNDEAVLREAIEKAADGDFDD